MSDMSNQILADRDDFASGRDYNNGIVWDLCEEITRLQSECETLRHDAKVMAEVLLQDHIDASATDFYNQKYPCQCEACAIAREYVGTECVK